jgi:hypothetical protein
MIRYAWYSAKLITSHEVFCNVNQVSFPAEEKAVNWSAESKHWIDVSGVINCCVFVAFIMSTIRNPANLSP